MKYIPTLWDLCSNSHVWLEQSTKIWAVVGKTTILAITVPFECGMTQNTGRVLYKLGSNRSKAQAKDLKKLNRRHGGTHPENKCVLSVWSCVNGNFTTKPHWDRVELVNVLSWFTFCPWLGWGGGPRPEEFLGLFGTPPLGISIT